MAALYISRRSETVYDLHIGPAGNLGRVDNKCLKLRVIARLSLVEALTGRSSTHRIRFERCTLDSGGYWMPRFKRGMTSLIHVFVGISLSSRSNSSADEAQP
jgi:hypothetical protein